MFPAHAGMARPTALGGPSRPHVPRTRGDGPQLCATHLTIMPTRAGAAYACFIIDAFPLTVVRRRDAPHPRTTMDLDAIKMARRSRGTQQTNLRRHSDAGSQPTPIRHSKRPTKNEAIPTIGTTADSHDNAPTETDNSYYKAELTHSPTREGRPRKTDKDVELNTLNRATGTTTTAHTTTPMTRHQFHRTTTPTPKTAATYLTVTPPHSRQRPRRRPHEPLNEPPQPHRKDLLNQAT